jgi:hypothetical protein
MNMNTLELKNDDNETLKKFIMDGQGPKLIHLQPVIIYILRLAEKSFGHEMIDFAIISHEQARDIANFNPEPAIIFTPYQDPGLLVFGEQRYLAIYMPIGGAGIRHVAERKFGIAYPMTVLDLVQQKFTFIEINDDIPIGVKEASATEWRFSIYSGANRAEYEKTIKISELAWQNGVNPENIKEKYRELHPLIVVESAEEAKPEGKIQAWLRRWFT